MNLTLKDSCFESLVLGSIVKAVESLGVRGRLMRAGQGKQAFECGTHTLLHEESVPCLHCHAIVLPSPTMMD